MQGQITRLGWPNNQSKKQASKVRQEIKIPPERPRKRLSHAVYSGLSPQHQHVKNTSSYVSAFCQLKRFFSKTTNLPEVIMVTIALSVSYALEKPWKCLKNEAQKFYSGGFCPGGFCLGVFVWGVYRWYCPGVLSRGGLS